MTAQSDGTHGNQSTPTEGNEERENVVRERGRGGEKKRRRETEREKEREREREKEREKGRGEMTFVSDGRQLGLVALALHS